MGGGYSDLNVYFNRKGKSFGNPYYEVITSQKNFEVCSNFVVFTHMIKFTDKADPLRYNIILYDGYDDGNKGNYLFGYYYPRNDNEIIKEVRTYYSVLVQDIPLVISFKTDTNTYNCYFSKLKEARWDRAYNIGEYSFGPDCGKKDLDEAFKNISRNRKIRFKIGSTSLDISNILQELGDDKNYRRTFIPKGNESILGIDYLLSLDSDNNISPDTKNQIDPYYLQPYSGKLYDGIMIYYARDNMKYKSDGKEKNNTALLLEFIGSCNVKVQIQRKDKDGFWWSEQPVLYKDDASLVKSLNEIKVKAESNSVNTIIIDANKTYQGVKEVKPKMNKAFTKYEHYFKKDNKPVTLFKREVKTIWDFESEFKTIQVDVYYLNHGGKQDTEPFLIVFFCEGRSPRKRKAYHFANKYDFKEWKAFKFEEEGESQLEDHMENKLYEKIRKIDDYVSCIPDLGLIRWYTYKILIGKDPTEEEVKKKEAAQRPAVVKPKEKDEGPPIPWIIAGSVGGGVFVISSAIGYGIYWYNTTIKLLT